MFNAIVGNPPYQEQHNNLTDKGEANVSSVFHHFQNIADSLSDMNSLIYPGERWMLRIGRYMDEFGYEQLNSPYLQKVILYPDSRKVFNGAWVSGGVSIVVKNKTIKNNGHWVFEREEKGSILSQSISAPGDRKISTHPLLNSVIDKMNTLTWERRLSDQVKTQKFFKILSDAVDSHPERFVLCNNDFTNKPEGFDIRVMTNDKPGKTGKAAWFWSSRKFVKDLKEIDQWKIIMSSANLTGQNGRTPNTEIIPPGTAVGRVRLVIAVFDTEQEALNCFKFLNTDIIRTLLTTTGNYITGFGSNVKIPDTFLNTENALDFTEHKESINQQLLNLLELTNEEIETIYEISSSLSPFSRMIFDE